jgi:tetratricopeptide (TPR) repeat protein
MELSMFRRVRGRHLLGCVLAGLALVTPVAAQSTGIIKGKVIDDTGRPVENARIVIEFADDGSRRQEVRTDKKGEFIQVGLFSGNYRVTAEKDKLGSQSYETRLRVAQAAEVNFQLVPGRGTLTQEDAAKSAELRTIFEEAVAASRAGNADESIAKFERAFEIDPSCYDCLYDIGHAYTQKRDYDKAEAAFKKALEVKPDYPEAYNGLAHIYNVQRRFDLAADASAKATALGGGGASSADAVYNQGVILWNAGRVSDARKQFEAAIQANPDHAESHYQLGITLVNEGHSAQAVTEFETYVRLAPEGPNAAQARALLAQLRKP